MRHARRLTRSLGWLLIVLAALLMIATASSAQTSKLEDATENGHDFMECDPASVAENFSKFGSGIEGGHGEECKGFGTEFTNTQARSWMFAVNDSQIGAVEEVATGRAPDGSLMWEIRLLLNTSEIRMAYEDAGIGRNIRSCDLDFTSEMNRDGQSLSFWVQVTPGDALSDTVVEGAWFNETGKVESASCAIPQEPDTVEDADSFFELNEFDVLDAYFEIRFWDSLPSQSTLDRIADPTDSSATMEVEGSEEAVWFLEPVPAENIEEDIIPGLAVSVPEKPMDNETFQVRVWAQNSILDPVKIQRPPNVTLARSTDTGALEWWNQSERVVEVSRVDHQAAQVQPGAVVWQVTFDRVPAADWVVSVRAQANSTTGQTVNLTASHPVTVDEAPMPVEIAGLDQNQLIYTGIFAGFFVWSLSKGLFLSALMALFPLPKHILTASAISPYPFGFKFGVIALTMSLLIEFIVRNGADLLPNRREHSTQDRVSNREEAG